VRANWNNNPWFPDVLEQERLDCLRDQPEEYDHIWEGGYATVTKGAYYASRIAEARSEGRITALSPDPLLTYRVYVDIGGTGAKADAFAMWVAQFHGTRINVLDYYEAQGQDLAAHLYWLRGQGYTPDSTGIWLPHDGATNDRVYDVSYESALKAAGYDVTVVPNQGKGAAAKRIEEARRLFPSIWFDGEKCEAGLDALGWYHEKWDDVRNVGLGPSHDWASHGADAFGLMCVAHEPPKAQAKPIKFAGWTG
jgi:phage terminase large subunit